MQTKYILLLLSVLSFGIRTAHAQNVTKQFDVAPFDRIQVSSALDVEVRKGNFDVVVDLAPGETKYLVVTTEDGVLKARLDRPVADMLAGNRNRKSPRILITMPTLKGITLSGASDGDIDDLFDFDQLDIDLSGASDLTINNLSAGRITLKAAGASDAKLHGKARVLEADLVGASDLKAFDLTVDEAIIRASGASDASITVNKRLEKTIRGGADVSHRGNPSTIVSNKKTDD